MPPGRRSVLRSVATAGLSAVCGCATAERDAPIETPTATALPVESPGDAGTPPGTDGPGDDDYYPEPTPVFEPSVEISLLELAGDDGPVAYDLEVVQSIATTETPPRLVARARNASTSSLGVGEVRTMRFWAARAGDGHELVLVPRDHGGSIGFMDGRPSGEGSCWQLDSRVVQSAEYRFETLGPGEAIDSELEVWWHGPVDTCFPTGTFAFAAEYDVWEPADGAPGSGDRYRFGFTLGVERP